MRTFVAVACLAAVVLGAALPPSPSSSTSVTQWMQPGCPTTYEAGGYKYDLGRLLLPSGDAYTYVEPAKASGISYTYWVSLCGPLTGKYACHDNSNLPAWGGASVCQTYYSTNTTTGQKTVPHSKITGVKGCTTVSASQTAIDQGFTMTIDGGTPCRNGVNRTSVVHVQCDFASIYPTLTFIGETSLCVYEFTLLTFYGCPKTTANEIKHDLAAAHLSAGSVLDILFAIVIVIYFGIGSLVKAVVNGARGAEAIPNIEFWRQVPGLVKDGLAYTFTLRKPTSAGATYDAL